MVTKSSYRKHFKSILKYFKLVRKIILYIKNITVMYDFNVLLAALHLVYRVMHSYPNIYLGLTCILI